MAYYNTIGDLSVYMAAQACQLPFAMRRPCKSSGPSSASPVAPTPAKPPRTPCCARRDSQAYDKFTLGAKVTAGDSFDLANPIVRAGRQSSFDAFDGETSRVVAAGAVVAALRHPSAVELTVSAAKGGSAPTEEEWDVMLRGL